MQVSAPLQALLSLQDWPAATGVLTHWPVAVSQQSVVQALLSSHEAGHMGVGMSGPASGGGVAPPQRLLFL